MRNQKEKLESNSTKSKIYFIFRDYTEKRLILKKPYKGQGVIKATVEPGK
jgi:hypothetical protein